jgi:hypothetical protein
MTKKMLADIGWRPNGIGAFVVLPNKLSDAHRILPSHFVPAPGVLKWQQAS